MFDAMPDLSILLLIIVRVTSFIVTIPFFSYRTIPATHRVLFGIFLAWMMYYTIPSESFVFDERYLLLVVKEAMIGLLIGLVASMIMTAIQIAGSFIDFQMGFAIANIIDPQTGAQSPLMGQFFNTIALLLLLALNGHHLLLDGIFYSYQFLPIGETWPHFNDQNTLLFLMKMFAMLFSIAFQMSVPIVATLFLVDIALGITARTVPQLNIFVIGFPIKIGVSFIVLFVMMGVMVAVMQRLFEFMIMSMRDLMAILGGG